VRWVHVLLLALLATSTACATYDATSNRNDPKLEAAVDAYLKPYVDLELFQGAVLIARGDSVVLENGYGLANAELGVGNTSAQVFRIASISKPFTNVALGRLVEEKKLALSDPLSRHLPGFPRGESITLDMLRTHQGGIAHMNSIPYDEEANEPNTLDSLVKRIAREPLAFAPGSRTRYSNGGYALLARIIEKVTGEAYADHMESAVFRPLGLTDTRHETDDMVIARRAYGYSVSRETRRGLIVPPFQEMATKTGGGSLVSTVRDLHSFLRAMNQDNVIRAATWKSLFPPDSIVSFQGRCPGFNVFMCRDFQNDVDVVVLCNNYAAGMVGTVGSDFLALARGLAVPPPRWRADLPADSARVAVFLGTYRAQAGALPYGDGPFSVRWHRGGLVLFRGEAPADAMIPQGDDAYLLRNHWSEMRLANDPGTGKPAPTLRPLWFSTQPVALERVSESTPGR
jgi:CubicO group peptidase (beta-lactamase class C family)